MSSFPTWIVSQILTMRKYHEGWGALTLLSELKADQRFANHRLPSKSTIGRLLKEQGLTKKYEPNNPLPLKPCKKPKEHHELWQIDGKGNVLVKPIGGIAMLNIKDIYSGCYVACFPSLMKNMNGHPNRSDYQTALRLGFLQHGLPQRVQTDHAGVFYDNSAKSPFPTTLHLWLIGLGINPCFSRVHQPKDQSQVERAHQTIHNQIIRRKESYTNWEHLFEWCEKRRRRLNEVIPSRSTDNKPPLIKYPEAKHSGRYYQIQKEARLIDLKKVYAFLAQGKWYRKVASNNNVKLGGHVYYIPKVKPGEQLQVTFCMQDQHLEFQNDNELLIKRIPIKGITHEILMGNLEKYSKFPALQLEIPFNWEAQKVSTTFWDNP